MWRSRPLLLVVALWSCLGLIEISQAAPTDYVTDSSSTNPSVQDSVFVEQKDLTQPTWTASTNINTKSLMPNCTEPSINDFPDDLFTEEQLHNGAFLFHVVVSAYVFYAIAYLCETFFVPSVEEMCKVLHIPADVAGATFMAIATSSPEFFTNVIGTFVTKGNIGVGSVVGSAVFNFLAIISWCGLVVKDGLELDWWPLTRDCGFYLFSIFSLIGVLWDGKVFWYEGLYFVILYIFYVIVVCKNAKIQDLIQRGSEKAREKCVIRRVPTRERLRELLVCSLSYDGFKGSSEITPLLSDKSGRYVLKPQVDFTVGGNNDKCHGKDNKICPDRKGPGPNKSLRSVTVMTPAVKLNNQENLKHCHGAPKKQPEPTGSKHLDSGEVGLFDLPKSKSWFKWLEFVLGWPVRCILHLTIPDCRMTRYCHWYPLTFAMCIVYMGVFSYLITWMMTVIGDALGIPDAVMGLTFIAAGTSLPEALSSVIVAQQGLGNMSVSNSVGSNTFNILLCLGLPWMIRNFILIGAGAEGYISMSAGAFGYVSIFLVASTVILYGLIAWNRFYLDFKIGVVAMIMYLLFLVLASLLELNFFFLVNPPTCKIT
ncbi:unnamed protein product [Allacma fusca]|uniref:Sodium/calcium exchanger membrane region domain-containing protein n=1 Tax=Allacma fusca TaxID=39272 RepID=A0A8J2JEI5_9HEXA|nr:unnamed protein product [Allacma fusca]